MKRFIPFLMGLTLICLSFGTLTEPSPLLPENCELSEDAVEDDAVISLVKVCRYHPVPTTSNQQCPSVAADLKITANCEGYVTAAVTVANLADSPVKGQSYPLPSIAEPIFFEYSAFGITTLLGPILMYEHTEMRMDHNLDEFPIFEAEVELYFPDISSLCNKPEPPHFFFDIRILNQYGGVYEIGNYSDYGNIFYCGLFEESCNYCPGIPNCQPQPFGQELVYENIMACGESCMGCMPPTKKTVLDNIEVSSLDQDVAATFTLEPSVNEELNMTTAPNPFTNQVTLTFNHKIESISALSLLDMSGKEILMQNNQQVGSHSLLLDTKDIPSGVYFCKVLVNNTILTKKIVKL